MVRELGGRDRLALAAAAVAVLNPISWFDSVVWGQADSFGVVFVLLGLRELWRDRPERAAIYTVIAAIIKPQLGILIPIVAVVDHPARAVAGRRVRRPGAHRATPIRILTTGLAGFLTAVAISPAVRAVGRRAQQPAAVPDVRPARAGRGRRRRLSVPDRQRLQPVGARAVGHRPEPGQRRLVGVRLRRHGPGLRRRHRRVRADPGRRDRHDPAAGRDRGHPHRRRPPPGPPDAPGRAGRPGPRLLRGPDPRPRALRLPVLRDGRDPGRHLGPVADRLHRPERGDLRQHVRRPDHDLPEQPVDRRLASGSGRRSATRPASSCCPCSMAWRSSGRSCSSAPARIDAWRTSSWPPRRRPRRTGPDDELVEDDTGLRPDRPRRRSWRPRPCRSRRAPGTTSRPRPCHRRGAAPAAVAPPSPLVPGPAVAATAATAALPTWTAAPRLRSARGHRLVPGPPRPRRRSGPTAAPCCAARAAAGSTSSTCGSSWS